MFETLFCRQKHETKEIKYIYLLLFIICYLYIKYIFFMKMLFLFRPIFNDTIIFIQNVFLSYFSNGYSIIPEIFSAVLPVLNCKGRGKGVVRFLFFWKICHGCILLGLPHNCLTYKPLFYGQISLELATGSNILCLI